MREEREILKPAALSSGANVIHSPPETSLCATYGTVPPACDKMIRTRGWRLSVPVSTRLETARVASKTNSSMNPGSVGIGDPALRAVGSCGERAAGVDRWVQEDERRAAIQLREQGAKRLSPR